MTPGEPVTVRKVWDTFGAEIRDASKTYGVPVELIVATIATESGGQVLMRTARREEPGWISDEETPNRVSIGPMQTLLSTAREALKEPHLTSSDLLIPERSIRAGTAYIAQQVKKTSFSPPLVAAAYNAGGLYPEVATTNRWRLRCYPLGTGTHIDRFVCWFNDTMRLPDAVGLADDAPSFARFLERDTVDLHGMESS